MRSRLAVVLAVAIAMVSIAAVVIARSHAEAARPVARATLPARPRSYLGVYEPGVVPQYAEIRAFGQVAGRQPNLAGY